MMIDHKEYLRLSILNKNTQEKLVIIGQNLNNVELILSKAVLKTDTVSLNDFELMKRIIFDIKQQLNEISKLQDESQ